MFTPLLRGVLRDHRIRPVRTPARRALGVRVANGRKLRREALEQA